MNINHRPEGQKTTEIWQENLTAKTNPTNLWKLHADATAECGLI